MNRLIAVPAYPYPIQYELPDGIFLTITLKGDEKTHGATSEDGYTLLMNAEGYYEYAARNKSNDLMSSGIRAMDVDTPTREEKLFLSDL